MKKILFAALLLLSPAVCLTFPVWAETSQDLKAGTTAANKSDYDAAIAVWTKAIEIDSKDVNAYCNRGNAWYDKGDYDKAIADWTKVIKIDSKHAIAYYNRGNAWASKGNHSKAIADYTKAIEIEPKHAFAYGNRGLAWGEKGDYDKAIADFDKAIEIGPKCGLAYNNLAWIMATCPEGTYRDGKRAVELAEKAVALKDAANRLGTLAAAYAEAGRFKEAIKTQEMAITKLNQTGETKDLPQYEEHLSSYKAGKPWREK